MTVNIMQTVKRSSFVILVAILVGGISASPLFAQEYKEAYNAGIEAAKAKNYTEAYSHFTNAAQLARQDGDSDVANRASKVAAQIDYNLGKQDLQNEDAEGALKRFETGIGLYPQYSNNYLGKALALKKMGRDEDAIGAYEELIAYGKENNDSDAVQEGEQGIRDHYIFLASSALGRQAEPSASQAREAVGYLEQLQEYVEADADTYFYLAAAHNSLGSYDEAISFADQALEMHRGSRTDAAKIYFVKGEALMYGGNTAAAKEAFQNATYGSYKSLAEHYLETL